jgi:tetratricopeptide (TPR) repeat protein
MNFYYKNLSETSSKLLTFFEITKSGALTVLSFTGLLIISIAIFTSLTSSDVKFEPLKVPSPFIDLGYSPEITTTRILDEIARINALSTSTKDIKNIGNKQPGDQLSNLQSLPLPGISGLDLNAIQELIQGLLGIKKEKITGEITYTKQLDRITYHVRIRQMPENTMLVNFSSDAEVPELIKLIGLKIIEKLDPSVAASYYRWSKDIDNSLRMVDEALRNDEIYDDNYALVGRAQIYIQKKNFELAQSDIDRIFKKNPDFAPAITTQGFLYNEKGEFIKGLEFSDKAKKIWPNNWRPFNIAGDALDGLGRGDEAELAYIETIKRNPSWWLSYDEIATFHIKRKRMDLAEEAFHKGLVKFPDNVKLLSHYAELLLELNRNEQALSYLIKAYKIEPQNIKVWMSFLRVDAFKNEPIVSEIKKMALEKIKNNSIDPAMNELKMLLNKV